MIMLCPGLRPACIQGRGDRAPPRKPPPTLFPAFPREAIRARITNPAEGRAPHAHKDGIGLAGACPHLATRYSFAPDDLVMPRLAHCLAIRARRPRPSEKIAFRVIPGLSPQGHPSSDDQSGGGAGSARPPRTELASPGHVHPGPSVLRSPPAIMTRLGLRPASPRGRGDRVPPRKTPFA